MSAPSFPSFPPSFSSFPDLDAGPSKQSEPTKKRDREKRRKHDSSSKNRDRVRHGKEERGKERHSPRRGGDFPFNDDEQRKKLDDTQKLNVETHRFFYSDRKGDSMNIQYGGLHAGDVPKYRLIDGGRNVLGLARSYIILRRAGKGVEIGLNNHRKLSKLTDSASRALLSQPASRRLLPSLDTKKYDEIDGFIRIPSRRGRGDVNETYRFITTGNDNISDSSSSSGSDDGASSDDDSDPTTLTFHQETLKSLEQELDMNPRLADKWFSLMNQTLSTIPLTSKNATKARSEITVSILARALAADPQNLTNKRLRLAYLKAGEEIWHESKLRSEWEDVLKVGGADIYLEWLEWKIRKGNKGVDGVVESAVRSLSSLGNDEDAEVGKVRVFWRVATAIKNAGYPERATAMFQAQAELTFNRPPDIMEKSVQAQLNDVEDFWDSECPRFMEEGSKGWATWYPSRSQEHPLTVSETTQSPSMPDLDPYRQWANQESFADRNRYLPTRSDSDTLDPYSTVLFADIRPMLFNILSIQAKDAFRMAWLSFLGLHIPGFTLSTTQETDWDDRWNMDFTTSPNYLDCIFPSDTTRTTLVSDSVAGVVVGREREYHSPFGPLRYWGHNVCHPLDLASAEPGKAVRRGLWTTHDVANMDQGIIRRLFATLRIRQDDPDWDALALAFEMAINFKSALKLSKAFLSTNRDSLLHWDAHAQLERLRGRLDEARNIYQTVLIASKPAKTQVDACRLWWNWAEMEWLAGSDQQALMVILSALGMAGPSTGVTILRARQSLSDAVQNARKSTRWRERESWIKLRALLELLTAQEPTEALAVFDEHLAEEGENSFHESLTTALLLMLYYHGTILKRPMPPAILRERSGHAIEAYPSNSIIIGVFLEGEKGQGVWGKVRNILGGNDGKAKDVARRIEEVWIAGWQKGGWSGEVERTRNGLATAVEHERTRASSVIWRFYIEFEIRMRKLQQAKKLLFRAIGECPLSKELYLLAFGPLRSVFQIHELNSFADTMAERGIRLRQGLDEVVEGMDIVEEEEKEDEEDSEDEIEHNARELRRLMPY
ncbi:NRDE-2, necessary for RNA interference-domain-containing protein [Crassisporium funariophilum]|nr:NRDE-2, necessary for RNA interference-domain-containing protein [Crassisporium funariophilum]